MKIIAMQFYPGTISSPAFLDMELVDENGERKYVTLQGRAAKRFSTLKVGDSYHEKPTS